MSNLGNKEVMARNLNYYMNLNGIDRNKLCKDLNFKYTTIREWTNGTSYPRIDKIEALANYFGISKSDLIEDNHITDSPPDKLDVLYQKYKHLLTNDDKETMIFLIKKRIKEKE